MAWLQKTYNNGRGIYWVNEDTGEESLSNPADRGEQVVTTPTPVTWSEGKYMDGQHSYFTNDRTGEVVYSKEATLTPEQREQEFMTLWNNPNASSWEKAQAVQKQYGIETLAQLHKQGHFADDPDMGAYIAARQREANDAGFTIGGNKLGLWPVALAMAGGALYGGTAASGASATAAEGAGAFGGMDAAAVAGADYGLGSAATGTTLAGGTAGLGQAELAALIESGTVGTEGAALEGAAGIGSGAAGATSGGGMDWWDELMMETGEYGADASALESGFNPSYDAGFYGEMTGGLGLDGKDLLRGGALINSLLGGAGNFLGGLKNVLPSADTAAAMVPILAAINYAKNQGGFDTSRLESSYDAFDPNALAFEYDQNTTRGREGLTSSLTNRGVMGSSFGNADITNFNTTRDMGRRSLINQGVLARTDPAKSILDAQIKERALKNQLYGQSLLAMGNVFGGKR